MVARAPEQRCDGLRRKRHWQLRWIRGFSLAVARDASLPGVAATATIHRSPDARLTFRGGGRLMSKARVVIEDLTPQVDCGRFPARRVLGDTVVVEADVFADGHDAVAASLLYRHESEAQWHGIPMTFLGNDRWQARFT